MKINHELSSSWKITRVQIKYHKSDLLESNTANTIYNTAISQMKAAQFLHVAMLSFCEPIHGMCLTFFFPPLPCRLSVSLCLRFWR